MRKPLYRKPLYLLVSVALATMQVAHAAEDSKQSCEADDREACKLCERKSAEGVIENVVCEGDARGKMIDRSATRVRPVPPNTEKIGDEAPSSSAPAETPFRITVDGVELFGAAAPTASAGAAPVDRQRQVDVGLERADIQVRYDALEQTPALNVWITPGPVISGEEVLFQSYSNYLISDEAQQAHLVSHWA